MDSLFRISEYLVSFKGCFFFLNFPSDAADTSQVEGRKKKKTLNHSNLRFWGSAHAGLFFCVCRRC